MVYEGISSATVEAGARRCTRVSVVYTEPDELVGIADNNIRNRRTPRRRKAGQRSFTMGHKGFFLASSMDGEL